MGTTILYGLQVMVVGLLVVFAGLVILIGCIKLMEIVMRNLQKKETPAAAAPAVEPAVEAEPEVEEEDEGELIAVITAAVAAMLAGEGGDVADESGFVVRRVRRVSAPAWNRAGREEQIYSRL